VYICVLTALLSAVDVTDVDEPYIDDMEVGENFVVVSWKPSTDPPSNPASEFVVEYRPEGLNALHYVDAR